MVIASGELIHPPRTQKYVYSLSMHLFSSVDAFVRSSGGVFDADREARWTQQMASEEERLTKEVSS